MARLVVELSIPPFTKIVAAVKEWNEDAIKAAMAALHLEHESIMTLAKSYTPVKTGALKRSGRVAPVYEMGGRIYSQGGFGGPGVSYAVTVHEDLYAFHRNGQAKFYETAVLERAPGMDQRLAARIKKFLG